MSSLRGPVCLDDYERYAGQHLDKNAFGYYSTGADEDVTIQENRQAFRRLKLRPRMLRKVAHQDLSVTVLGHQLRMPICVSPTGFQGMAHPDGELATVRDERFRKHVTTTELEKFGKSWAADNSRRKWCWVNREIIRAVSSLGTAMGLSVYSTHCLEDVARQASNTVKFFQLQFYTDRQLMKELLRRAESAGYKAILLTVDIPVYGKHASRRKFFLPRHLEFANFSSVKDKKGLKTNEELDDYIEAMNDGDVDWETFDWLRSVTSLPFVLKGILTSEDARLAVQHGAQGIMVSNHGGRQLDGVLATIEALPEIIEAVRGTGVEVYCDGGVRTGTDVLKALALGARAVFIGRPVLWGLAYKGEEGVVEVLRMLRDEFKVAMALAGCASLKDITPSLVMRHQASHL